MSRSCEYNSKVMRVNALCLFSWDRHNAFTRMTLELTRIEFSWDSFH